VNWRAASLNGGQAGIAGKASVGLWGCGGSWGAAAAPRVRATETSERAAARGFSDGRRGFAAPGPAISRLEAVDSTPAHAR